MNQKLFAAVTLLSLCVSLLLVNMQPGRSQQPLGFPLSPAPRLAEPVRQAAPPLGCAVRPDPTGAPTANTELQSPLGSFTEPLTLSRFRQPSSQSAAPTNRRDAANRPTAPAPRLLDRLRNRLAAAPTYTPKEEIALADPTNFGDRFLNDLQGRPAEHPPIVVLHETVGSASGTINYFQTPHPRDEDQVSYHTLVKLDGTLVYLVPPDKRAFGAGDSVFASEAGNEAVQTNPAFSASVNNFAYHISLETPPDGNNNGDRHSGYTNAQYNSLAWLVAKTGVPDARLTTHKLVDRSGSRKDPRSFNAQTFLRLLNSYPRTQEIVIGCSR